MTGKRFKLGDYSNNLQEIWFDEDYIIVRQDDAERLCELLNNFNNENKQLTYELEICRNNKLFSRRQLEKENEQLKEALFFYLSVAITETSSHINEDLEKECNQLLKCSYKEALKKYDTSKYEGV